MATDFPWREGELLTYAETFSAVLTASPTTYGCTAGQATTLAGLVTTYGTTYATANEPSTRTRPAIANKNDAKRAMLTNMRVIARLAHAAPSVTDGELLALGLTPRANPSPINPPTEPPVLEVISVIGRIVKVKLHGVGTDRRGKPEGVASASVYSFVGAVPPADNALWTHQGTVTRTSFDVTFPASTPAGSQVWLVAMWTNPREMYGPPCMPVETYLSGGVAAAA